MLLLNHLIFKDINNLNNSIPLSLSILANPKVVEKVEHEFLLLNARGVCGGEFCILQQTDATLLA